MHLPDGGWEGVDDDSVSGLLAAVALSRSGSRDPDDEPTQRVIAHLRRACKGARDPCACVALESSAAWLSGDIALARASAVKAAVAAVQPPVAWGPAAIALTIDTGRGLLLVDFARRLAEERPDDADAQAWALRTLVITGHAGLAMRLAAPSEHPRHAGWTATMADIAHALGQRDTARRWLCECVAGPAFGLPPDAKIGDVMAAAGRVLGREEAVELLEDLAARWSAATAEARIPQDAAEPLWRLIAVADSSELALLMTATVASCENDATSDEPLPGGGSERVAALVAEAVFDRDGRPPDGIAALVAWRALGRGDRHRATLLRLVGRLRPEDVAELSDDDRARLAREGQLACVGMASHERECLRRRLAGSGIAMSDDLAGVDSYASSLTGLLEHSFRSEAMQALRQGSFPLARALALDASLDRRLGASPGRLMVDALVHGGSALEAQQLANHLVNLYPDDASALAAALITAGWRARQDEAADHALAASDTPSALPELLPAVLRDVASVDPRAALSACRRALADRRYQPAHGGLRALAAEIEAGGA